MSFTSNEKSYGGYSSFSPMRHAERSGDKKKERNKNVPAYVHDKVEEIMEKQKEKDEGQAWAVAWSIYCKHKKPNSPHCKKEKDDYFPGRKKKASWTKQEQKEILRVALKTSGIIDQLVSKGLLHISRLIKANTNSDREEQLVYYLWTNGKFPQYMARFSTEARILGKIASTINYEKKVQDVTYQEERVAYKVLHKICKYSHAKWSSRVWAKVWFAVGQFPIRTIRVEFLKLNHVKHAVEYTRLLRYLYND